MSSQARRPPPSLKIDLAVAKKDATTPGAPGPSKPPAVKEKDNNEKLKASSASGKSGSEKETESRKSSEGWSGKKLPGPLAKSVQLPMPEAVTFNVDIITSVVSLPSNERSYNKIAAAIRDEYRVEGLFKLELFQLVKLPENQPIPENTRVCAALQGSATFSSYLEYLNEQNRQLAAKLEGSDDAVITLSNEIERLCSKLKSYERKEKEREKEREKEKIEREKEKAEKKAKRKSRKDLKLSRAVLTNSLPAREPPLTSPPPASSGTGGGSGIALAGGSAVSSPVVPTANGSPVGSVLITSPSSPAIPTVGGVRVGSAVLSPSSMAGKCTPRQQYQPQQPQPASTGTSAASDSPLVRSANNSASQLAREVITTTTENNTTITTITTTTIITNNKNLATGSPSTPAANSASPAAITSPRLKAPSAAGKRENSPSQRLPTRGALSPTGLVSPTPTSSPQNIRKLIPGLDLPNNLTPSDNPRVRSPSAPSSAVAHRASDIIDRSSEKQILSERSSDRRGGLHPNNMSASVGGHATGTGLELYEGRLGGCRQCHSTKACTQFKSKDANPPWICECGHLSVKHVTSSSPRSGPGSNGGSQVKDTPPQPTATN